MAKQTNGTLGGFVGKLGPVVGYRWKNVWCVRSQTRIVNNPRTEAQQEHRSLFKQEVQLAGRMRWAVNIGLKELSDQMDMTAQNLFVRANQQCFNLVDGRMEVDYANLCVSAGSVAPVAITEWGVDADNVLEVSFEKNPLHLSCSQFDNVYVWVWCPEAGVGYLANAVYRRMKHMSTGLRVRSKASTWKSPRQIRPAASLPTEQWPTGMRLDSEGGRFYKNFLLY